jgi:hypothetical protein
MPYSSQLNECLFDRKFYDALSIIDTALWSILRTCHFLDGSLSNLGPEGFIKSAVVMNVAKSVEHFVLDDEAYEFLLKIKPEYSNLYDFIRSDDYDPCAFSDCREEIDRD